MQEPVITQVPKRPPPPPPKTKTSVEQSVQINPPPPPAKNPNFLNDILGQNITLKKTTQSKPLKPLQKTTPFNENLLALAKASGTDNKNESDNESDDDDKWLDRSGGFRRKKQRTFKRSSNTGKTQRYALYKKGGNKKIHTQKTTKKRKLTKTKQRI